MYKIILPFLLLLFRVRPVLAGWDVDEYLIVRNITTQIVPDYVRTSTVYPTGTVTPTSTSVETTRTAYVSILKNGGLGITINVTTTFLFLPTDATDLPLATTTTAPEYGETTSSIETNYYMPITISNPKSCTLTDFTYTDVFELGFTSAWMTDRATESDMASLVTTYKSIVSTNLGGQAVSTSRCDVYLKADAIPLDDPNKKYAYVGLLSECVDPRKKACTNSGQNTAATGSEGCEGAYPPTAVATNEVTSTGTDSDSKSTETGGAISWGNDVNGLRFTLLVGCLVAIFPLVLV